MNGIRTEQGLEGFDAEEFIRARQRCWKETLKRFHPETDTLDERLTPIETNFIVAAKGDSGHLAVFEDEGDTGYLYLYASREKKVLRYVHVYDRSEKLDIDSRDVEVKWSRNRSKCGVMILGEMRAIMNVEGGVETRIWLEEKNTPGIRD